jgi:hypothetical protein
VLDDHSRVAYSELHEDESQQTAAAVLRNAVAWFAQRGVPIVPGRRERLWDGLEALEDRFRLRS